MDSEDEFYEVPEELEQLNEAPASQSVATQKERKKKIHFCCFDFIAVFALTLATPALILAMIPLVWNSDQLSRTHVDTLQAQWNDSIRELKAFEHQTQEEILKIKSDVQNISDKLSALQKSVTRRWNDLPPSTVLTPEDSSSVSPTTVPIRPATTIPPIASTEVGPTSTTSSLLPDGETCGGPGWRRVALINMTDPNQDCPQGLSLTDYSIRSCGRAHTGFYNCSSVVFSIGDDSQYSHVCGRATAYRWGRNYGFYAYNNLRLTVEGAYVDGLSLTHGTGTRSHIWTFASGAFNGTSRNSQPNFRCPCDPGNTFDSPSFVGNDYFCESVATVSNWDIVPRSIYPDNALWDGHGLLNACYGLNNPPWFNKTLPVPTTDDIELRLCFSDPAFISDIAIELLELWVH